MTRLHLTATLRLLTMSLLLTASFQASNASGDDLSSLVAQRLHAMKDVAAYKWQQNLPIEDIPREKLVLASAVHHGLRYRLTQQSSLQFFEIQIEAAKEVQRYWFGQWQRKSQSPPDVVIDLDQEIRPELIRLGKNITAALARKGKKLGGLEVEGLSRTTATKLAVAARAVTVYPNVLAQILDSGLLRVGTTGDYPPFSSRSNAGPKQGSREGIDIDLAVDLGRSLGVEIEWVPSSWPELMNDLHGGLFDIGMSGVSINLLRQQTAFFSRPYHRGGKTPIIRCSDSEKYSSLLTIDQPATRLIVNPGGTNQGFVSAHIKKAKVRVFEDNRSIFDEILNHRADVMITDQIEVRLQVTQHEELCNAMGDATLTFSEKAYLLPQDIVWKEFVDTWLAMRQHEGLVKQVFDRHLPAKPDVVN